MLNILIKEKSYSGKLILKNIQLSIPQNGLYGVVGKNGAGKTTFFKCLCSLTSFKGEVSYQQQPLMPQQIGFLPTEPYLYEHLTVEEFYKFYSLLLDIKPQNTMPFEVNKNLLIKELSTGMRKKVYFNAVLQKPYTLYIFDEPFSGLKKLSETHIVLFASHILETLSDCKEIYLLYEGNAQIFLPSNLNKIEDFLSL